ncbi:hypothetical protein L3X38_033770 [Prunus dulcis]|uniref:Uncharacterized protein n=1 Tax=Prunus dulcis TaxID=3755 RepID=A0AAD4YW85_PRUDU|nr:hypothetical protein L3X38_033770 [Prunus dulcis]
MSVQSQQQASTMRLTPSQLETQQCHPNLSTPSHEDEPLITPSEKQVKLSLPSTVGVLLVLLLSGGLEQNCTLILILNGNGNQ